MDASSSPWTPTPAPVSSPSLLLPIPAIVVLSVGIYLLLLGLVLLTRHCLLAQGCCTDCSAPCRKQGASRPQDCCQTCAEACDFPLPSPARYLDACCPQPAEAMWPQPSWGLHSCKGQREITRTGPLAALAAARSATVPVRANFLTARASTASALRSSSDDDPSGSLLFGERPAPRAHRPCQWNHKWPAQLTGPGTGSGEPGSLQSGTHRALGQQAGSPLAGPGERGLVLRQIAVQRFLLTACLGPQSGFPRKKSLKYPVSGQGALPPPRK
ncbi:hypothetical protein FD754_013580 [Muntiacus muntjak]|uniref:Uncharacterized protein n=1 Tax=Muntiacus muntjak TaxID=9888 RepID=A0A5N3VI50_MUNMU|nr:hypothetical protein FD754_013580 [Muntiacus muntjak]